MTNNLFIFTFLKAVKYVLQWWMKNVLTKFCPFRPYTRMQRNISDIFARFSIRSCNKQKMKTQEIFKKNCDLWQTISLSLLFQRLSNMTVGGTRQRLEKSRPEWLTNRINRKSVKYFLEASWTKSPWEGRKRGLLDAHSVRNENGC